MKNNIIIKRLVFTIVIGLIFYGLANYYQFIGRLGRHDYPSDTWAYILSYPTILATKTVFKIFNTDPETTLAVGLMLFFFQFALIGYLLSMIIFKNKTQKGPEPQESMNTPQSPTPMSLPTNQPPTTA